MDARDLSDRELLVLTYEAVQDIRKDLYGNGRPGLIKEFESLKAEVNERTAPSKVQVFGLTGALTVFLTVATEFIKGKIGAQ